MLTWKLSSYAQVFFVFCQHLAILYGFVKDSIALIGEFQDEHNLLFCSLVFANSSSL